MKSLLNILKNPLLIGSLFLISLNTVAQDNMGNPIPHFLFPSFREGVIIFKNGERVKMLLDYNMVEQMMVTELDGVYRYSKNPAEIDTIYIENRVFVPVGNIFYELLSTGTYPFYLQNKSNFTPKGADIGYGAKSHSVGPTQYTRFEETGGLSLYNTVVHIELPQNVEITPASMYWVNKNGEMEKFTSVKQFLKIFPEKATMLKEYIKKEKLNLKHRQDVIRLGNYCNVLYMK
jgi:hypothetical protein